MGAVPDMHSSRAPQAIEQMHTCMLGSHHNDRGRLAHWHASSSASMNDHHVHDGQHIPWTLQCLMFRGIQRRPSTIAANSHGTVQLQLDACGSANACGSASRAHVSNPHGLSVLLAACQTCVSIVADYLLPMIISRPRSG